MGNQLVGIAPSQIFPVEHYLTENQHLQNLTFDANLGSTRFFKVARAGSVEGLVVVKVFAIHDPSLPLAAHKSKAEVIRAKLSSAVNCLPFQRAVLTDKAGFLVREFVKYSLYDRMSTRPFFTNIEKKWIAFQVLYALHKCHEVGVCHGDIKLENIMVTSWHWVFLVDFASFKPTYLSEHNPADFSYFFDTSRRRTCYIAPERFIKTLGTELTSDLLLDWNRDLERADLTPAMDIFSAGCALTELFTEGHPPFDFAQLLEYRTGNYSPDKCLDRIDDPDVKELLRHMMQRDPSMRLSAETYLRQERGRVFPEVFYTFLQSYTLAFSAAPILSADEKISRLRKDIDNIISILSVDSDMEKSTSAVSELNLDSNPAATNLNEDNCSVEATEKNQTISLKEINQSSSEALVIITSLVTSCIRGLKLCMSKRQALDILLMLSAHASAETILDRILPYVLSMLHDPLPRVRVKALHTLSKALQYVKTVPVSDTNIFPEYILPGLSVLTKDQAVIVRAAYAENIAQLAETALRFLEHSQVWQNAYGSSSGDGSGEAPTPDYEMELQTLHGMIQQTVATLITDPQSLVKQTLLENGITKLCVFFGKQKANDVLLSHMITFLNDKEDKHLRGSFFDCIVGVAAYVGYHASPIIFPLLQQGLSDSEELVSVKAVNAMRALTELGLLHKSALYELLNDCAPFLVHPNLWLRHAVVGFISATSRSLSIVDVQCKVMQALEPYLLHAVIQPDKEVLLLNALKPPVPREILDSILKSDIDVQVFFETLQERHNQRSLVRSGHVPQYTEIHSGLQSLFRRLIDKGMTEEVEDYLSAMSKHLVKIQKHRSHHDVFLIPQESNTGIIDLANTHKAQAFNVTLVAQEHTKGDSVLSRKSSGVTRVGRRGPSAPELMPAAMNKEWLHMFGGVESGGAMLRTADGQPVTGSPPRMILDSDMMLPHRSLDTAGYSLPEHFFTQFRCPPCQMELKKLIERKQEQYSSCARTRLAARDTGWETPLPPPGWRLRGTLVAHLHEHRAAVNRLAVLPETSLFASASADGCIRIWDCSKMEGRNIANRSRITANRQTGPLIGLAACPDQTLAAASQTGDVFVLRVETTTNKTPVLQSRQLDLQEDGCAVDVASFQSGPVVVYATMYGSIVGWDLRQPGTAWKLENDLKHGVITTMCVDPNESWLALGTSSGYHICWDLRFQLPISTFSHQENSRVRRLVCHPTEPSWLISSVQGNNEISMWNMEMQCRQSMLWASNAQPFSSNSHDNQQRSPNSVCAMYAGTVDKTPFLIAGGSDRRLRYWDLESHVNSHIVVSAAHNDNLNPAHLMYRTRLIDGVNVVIEEKQTRPRTTSSGPGSRGSTAGVGSAASSSEETPRPGPEQPPAGHQDWISDVALCQASQCFLISASCDGVIKVWK